MREIDYEKLLKNISEMVNLLEYDSMRSAGKSKINASTLKDLIELQKHYTQVVSSTKQPLKKEAK